jgi:hypothetical protein
MSKITSGSHMTSLDMTSFLSRIFQHDSRTWNCHWDGLYQEKTPSESSRRYIMDVSYLILVTSLLVLCGVHCADRIDGLRICDVEAKMGIDTIGGGWRQRASEFDGSQRRWPLVFDGGDGRLLWQQWTVDNRYRVQWRRWRWRSMTTAAFDGVFDGFGDGLCSEAMASRGKAGTTRVQKVGARREATQQPASTMRGQEGGTTRGR